MAQPSEIVNITKPTLTTGDEKHPQPSHSNSTPSDTPQSATDFSIPLSTPTESVGATESTIATSPPAGNRPGNRGGREGSGGRGREGKGRGKPFRKPEMSGEPRNSQCGVCNRWFTKQALSGHESTCVAGSGGSDTLKKDTEVNNDRIAALMQREREMYTVSKQNYVSALSLKSVENLENLEKLRATEKEVEVLTKALASLEAEKQSWLGHAATPSIPITTKGVSDEADQNYKGRKRTLGSSSDGEEERETKMIKLSPAATDGE